MMRESGHFVITNTKVKIERDNCNLKTKQNEIQIPKKHVLK